jgi:hypothetical protein
MELDRDRKDKELKERRRADLKDDAPSCEGRCGTSSDSGVISSCTEPSKKRAPCVCAFSEIPYEAHKKWYTESGWT